ncbi:MAG: cytochrome-c peroxidase [Acidobacteriota bacterium]
MWSPFRQPVSVLSLLCAAVLAGCGGGGDAGSTTGGSSAQAQSLSDVAALGQLIFTDTNLSKSGVQSCASCHDAGHAHAAPNNLSVQLGGPLGTDRHGTRVSPSMRYLRYNTDFHFDAEGTPTGGFFWDGRAKSLADQAKGPFVNPREMANDRPEDVVAKVAQGAYAQEFKRVFGAGIFADPAAAYERIALALQAFQQEDAQFAPFTSKYDAFLRGQTKLSDQELRGLALFNSPSKGNCAACHPSGKGRNGSLPLFTDFSYDGLGVPRNWTISDNVDPTVFDLGLCDSRHPVITALDETTRQGLCGKFKVPSLRNVAQRGAFFHNGVFHDLTTVVTFYAQRETHPEKWYLDANGQVDRDVNGQVNKYNDLPLAYRNKDHVNTTEAPYNRTLGDAPALTDAEIQDLVVFLGTLSDGWSH